MKKSLCLLVWNELKGCQIDVPGLPIESFHEVYAVDGGSIDGTVEFLQSRGIPVHKQPRKGLNAAYHHAVNMCTGEALVVFFPKATVPPSCVLDMAKSLDEGMELVVASRNIRGAVNEEDAHFFKPRKWGVMCLGAFAASLWRTEGSFIRDVLHGVRGFSIPAFRRMKLSETGLTVDLEMIVRSYRLRLSRMEIPVCESPRIAGKTHFKILPVAKTLFKFLVREIIRPPSLQP